MFYDSFHKIVISPSGYNTTLQTKKRSFERGQPNTRCVYPKKKEVRKAYTKSRSKDYNQVY